MVSFPDIDQALIRAIADVLGNTNDGFTNREIEELLAVCQLHDPVKDLNPPPGYYAGMTKRDRLYDAFAEVANRTQSPSGIFNFIQEAMKPARHLKDSGRQQIMLEGLNSILSLVGLEIGEDAQYRQTTIVKTVSEAEERAHSLRTKLLQRTTHPIILQFCRAELLEKNYFHAVLEAAKSLAHEIREISGLTSDGVTLVKEAFSVSKAHPLPVLAINTFQSDTEVNEHHGLRNLLIGIFKMFRNPTAHEPKIYWPINEQDALDILATISFAHRKLENAVKTGYTP